jgi:glycosyltransferase involved in cell wall biosynthesis
MRIGINLVFLVSGEGGGIERHIRGLLRGLEAVGGDHEYVLFTSRNCTGTFRLGPTMREVVCDVSARFRPAKIVWEQTVLPFQLRQHGIDVVLSPANIGPIVVGRPSVLIMHDVIPFKRPEIFTTIERVAQKTLFSLSARASDAILTVSESSKRDIAELFDVAPAKIHVVPGAAEEKFRPVAITESVRAALREARISDRYLLYVAAGRAYKNVDGLIRAFAQLAERIPHSLVITGLAGRASDDIQRLVVGLGLADRVVFTGFLDDALLPALYSAADVFVFPSFYEGFGLPVIEAMACGTPVVASDRTSIPEAVGDAGLLFDPSRVDDIANAIERVLEDKALRDSLVLKGLARAKLLSWETTAARTLSVLGEVA